MASRDEMLERLRKVLDDPSHPAWLGALKFVVEQGYGRAAQALAVSLEEPPPKQVLVIGDQRIEF